MKKTIKQAEYGDEIVHIDKSYKHRVCRFIGVHPDNPNLIIYSYVLKDGSCSSSIKESSVFFGTFKLKPKERWVLVSENSEDSDLRGIFSSMEDAISYAENKLLFPSKWEAVQLKD